MSGWYMENVWEPGAHCVIDLGYLGYQVARDRADQLRQHIGRRNFSVEGHVPRLVVRVPPTKLARIFEMFPDIKVVKEGSNAYLGCTHYWNDGATEMPKQ